ncbi:MAG: non-homologous end-joining DNA ligase, partial [Acidimicrobiia bacterium]
ALYELDLANAVLDGEIAALDEQGRSSFPLLQKRTMGAQRPPIAYYVFDLLYVNGHNLMDRPLLERRAALEPILPEHPIIRLSKTEAGNGGAFYAAAQQLGVEGITGKRGVSLYQPGKRTPDWVKLKVKQRLEAVIGGYTQGEGARSKTFGAVLLGAYEDGRLRYIGRCGGGFKDAELRRVYNLLRARVQPSCPFGTLPPEAGAVTWVRPELVAEIEYAGWTIDGILRFPVYLGLRDDKPASEVRLERPVPVAMPSTMPRSSSRTPTTGAVTSAKRRTLHPLEAALQQAGLRVELTNLEKVFWPEKGYTKGDLIEYYLKIGPVILPHLQDRPVSMSRYPNGIRGGSFYQKDYPDAPEFVT